MPGSKKESKINLLPREEFLSSTTGRILAWVLSTFRIIVIVTEVLVMIAFISRFWLDAQNTDLSEMIEQKQRVLASSLEFEKEFRDTQKRLTVFNQYSETQGRTSQYLDIITSYIPPEIFLENVSFGDKTITIKGFSVNEISIQQYIVNLKSTDKFEDITIKSLKSDDENQIVLFSLSISLTKQNP